MKKATCILLSALVMAQPVMVFADNPTAPTEPTQLINPRNEVTFSYREALDLILGEVLPIQDLDTFITDMQIQYREMRYQLRQAERGDLRQENIRLLHEQLALLENAMMQTRWGQEAVNMQVQASLGSIFAGGITPDTAANMGASINAATAGMAQGAALDTQMGTLEAQRNMLWNELVTLNDDDLFRDMIDEMRRGLDELERQVDGLHFNQDLLSLTWESVMRSLLIALAEMDLGIATLEANIELMELNHRRMTVSYEVGVISSHTLRTVEHGISQANTQLAELRRSQDMVRQNLNRFMGQPLAQFTVIEFDRNLITAPTNLDSHIENLIANNPTIKQAQFDIDRAKAARRAYTGNDREIRVTDVVRRRAQNAINPTRNSEDEHRNEQIRIARNRVNLQDAVDRAILGKEQLKRNMEAALRRGYSDLEALFIQEESIARDLEQAELALTIAEANFAAGRITRFDVEQAILNVATVQQSKESVYNQMWILSFQLANPSLLGD